MTYVKPAIWIKIILFILLIAMLILAIVGCGNTHRKPWRERTRVIVYEQEEKIRWRRK